MPSYETYAIFGMVAMIILCLVYIVLLLKYRSTVYYQIINPKDLTVSSSSDLLSSLTGREVKYNNDISVKSENIKDTKNTKIKYDPKEIPVGYKSEKYDTAQNYIDKLTNNAKDLNLNFN